MNCFCIETGNVLNLDQRSNKDVFCNKIHISTQDFIGAMLKYNPIFLVNYNYYNSSMNCGVIVIVIQCSTCVTVYHANTCEQDQLNF